VAQVPVDAAELTHVQRGVLDSLTEDGLALVPFDELIEDADLWRELCVEMDAFVDEVTAQLASGEREVKKQKDKFIVRRFARAKSKSSDEVAVLASDGPWLRFAAHDKLLDVVNAYRGGEVKLVDFDQWYTIPLEGTRERFASQQWHRDPEDRHVVKVFLYFSDVDEESGPFEYVRRSAPGKKYGHLWPWEQREDRYPPPDELERAIDPADQVRATGPVGTVVICDTSGFHRGGYALSKPRILETHTYVRKPVKPGSKSRRFSVDWRDHELSPQARHALS
jgi:hypothetical protein